MTTLDRYTVRKQWLIAWNNFWRSWCQFEWFCTLADNKLIKFSLTMLLMMSFKDGTNLYYIGQESKISTAEKVKELCEAQQDITTNGCNDDRFVSYYEFRLAKVEANDVEVDCFI